MSFVIFSDDKNNICFNWNCFTLITCDLPDYWHVLLVNDLLLCCGEHATAHLMVTHFYLHSTEDDTLAH